MKTSGIDSGFQQASTSFMSATVGNQKKVAKGSFPSHEREEDATEMGFLIIKKCLNPGV